MPIAELASECISCTYTSILFTALKEDVDDFTSTGKFVDGCLPRKVEKMDKGISHIL